MHFLNKESMKELCICIRLSWVFISFPLVIPIPTSLGPSVSSDHFLLYGLSTGTDTDTWS